MSKQRFEALIRDEFADLGKWIYLDSHRAGVLPTRTRVLMTQFIADHGAPRPASGPQWTKYVNGARAALSGALTIDEHAVAFTNSASAALSLVLDNLPRLGISEVLAMAEEYPPYLRYLKELESRGAVRLRLFHHFDQLLAVIRGPHQLVLVSQVCWRSGRSYDMSALGAAKRRSGSMLALDVVHVVGCFPFHTVEADPEFAFGTTRKWLLGIAGLGYLYLGSRVREHLTATCTSVAQAGYPDNADDWYRPSNTDHAARFEVGARNKLALVALRSSLSLFAEVGLETVATRIETLRAHLISGLLGGGLGGDIESRAGDRSPIVSLMFRDTVIAERVVAALRERRVMASRIENAVLLGLHFFLTRDHLTEVVGNLTELTSPAEYRG